MVQTETSSLVETAKQQSPTPTAARRFMGAMFYGENSPSMSTRPRLQQKHIKKQTYKRIKHMFDSSNDEGSPPLT